MRWLAVGSGRGDSHLLLSAFLANRPEPQRIAPTANGQAQGADERLESSESNRIEPRPVHWVESTGPSQFAHACPPRQLTPSFLGRESHFQRVHRDQQLFRNRAGGQSVNALMNLRTRTEADERATRVRERCAILAGVASAQSLSISSGGGSGCKNLVLRLRPENLAESAALRAHRVMSGDVLRSIREETIKRNARMSMRQRAEHS